MHGRERNERRNCGYVLVDLAPLNLLEVRRCDFIKQHLLGVCASDECVCVCVCVCVINTCVGHVRVQRVVSFFSPQYGQIVRH